MEKHFLHLGAKEAVPVVLGYAPIALSFGILAAHIGLSPLVVVCMSLFVYAGASQLIALSLIASNAGIGDIIFLTFIFNFRHALMSASVSPYLRDWSFFHKALFGFGLTDETFALNYNRFASDNTAPHQAITLNVLSHISWIIFSFIGSLTGKLHIDVYQFGVDFALPALFTALLLPWLKKTPGLIAALVGALTSLLCAIAFQGNNMNIIVGALLGAIAASYYVAKKEKRAL